MPLLLPHDIPHWVDESSKYFITICCTPRNTNRLCHSSIAQSIIDSAVFYHTKDNWYLHLILLMPDHAHALISFPQSENIKKRILLWKQYTSRKMRITWQKDFFEHRIRNDDEFSEKYHYIRMNPVRAELVKNVKEWPFSWSPYEGTI